MMLSHHDKCPQRRYEHSECLCVLLGIRDVKELLHNLDFDSRLASLAEALLAKARVEDKWRGLCERMVDGDGAFDAHKDWEAVQAAVRAHRDSGAALAQPSDGEGEK